jgi:hypothetical protein
LACKQKDFSSSKIKKIKQTQVKVVGQVLFNSGIAIRKAQAQAELKSLTPTDREASGWDKCWKVLWSKDRVRGTDY